LDENLSKESHPNVNFNPPLIVIALAVSRLDDNSYKLVVFEENSLYVLVCRNWVAIFRMSLVSKWWVDMVLEEEVSHSDSNGHGDMVQITRKLGSPKNASKAAISSYERLFFFGFYVVCLNGISF